jgi:hypothetical protein
MGLGQRRHEGTFVFWPALASISMEPESTNTSSAKGFIGLRFFPVEVRPNSALMSNFPSRISHTAIQETCAANVCKCRNMLWHRHFAYSSAQRRKFNADAHIAGESAEMSYRRTKIANTFPP